MLSSRETGKFSRDLNSVSRQLRSALSSLITSVGLDPYDPQILNRHWGVNKTLSWKIAKIIQTDEPYLALQQLPGREGIDILLQKGEASGVQSKFVEATKRAVDEFDLLVKSHCGDRETFDMMGSDLTHVGRKERDEQHRKQLFHGASYLWGVQARVILSIYVIAPGASVDGSNPTCDFASISGQLDFRRLRENVSWVLSRRSRSHDSGSLITGTRVEPLDPSSANLITPLIPEFCSKPLPVIEVYPDTTTGYAELTSGEVGNEGAISFVGGSIDRGWPLVRTRGDQYANFSVTSNTPAEVLIFDCYIHESMTYAMPPEVMLRGTRTPLTQAVNDHERFQLPLSEPLLELGAPVPARVTPEVPRYSEMLDLAFNRTGWSPAAFRGFRLKMAYPPMQTALLMRFPLPEPTL